jgi:hypothetical protein
LLKKIECRHSEPAAAGEESLLVFCFESGVIFRFAQLLGRRNFTSVVRATPSSELNITRSTCKSLQADCRRQLPVMMDGNFHAIGKCVQRDVKPPVGIRQLHQGFFTNIF